MSTFIKHLLLSLAFAGTLGPAHAGAPEPSPAPAAPKPSASQAFEKQDATFLKLHASFLERARSGPIGLLFLGDSITAGWRRAPHIWDAYYGKYQPANFGIGGARTQNLIWQIEHGELDGIAPAVVVLMLGTNNSLSYSASEIVEAQRKIVAMIRTRLPDTRVLLLGILPRGPRDSKGGPITPALVDDAAARMATIGAVNRQLAALDDGNMVRFLDIGPVFLGQDGRIPTAIMPDQLHPAAAGYQLWADAMQPLLESMLQVKR